MWAPGIFFQMNANGSTLRIVPYSINISGNGRIFISWNGGQGILFHWRHIDWFRCFHILFWEDICYIGRILVSWNDRHDILFQCTLRGSDVSIASLGRRSVAMAGVSFLGMDGMIFSFNVFIVDSDAFSASFGRISRLEFAYEYFNKASLCCRRKEFVVDITSVNAQIHIFLLETIFIALHRFPDLSLFVSFASRRLDGGFLFMVRTACGGRITDVIFLKFHRRDTL
mmetsp:Transcript_17406/g.42653  ORF Transcript_17406/g.42653 Transcript_17406/m.42653 type:complete len:227 (-) Transcript_17406:34-714(-)